MILSLVQAAAGLIALVFAGDILVRGAAGMADRLGVPALLIGLTVVAFGTSAPELMVGVKSVLSGAPTLALGNVVGSNIANTLLVIGLPALITPLTCIAPRMARNMFIMLAVTILFIGLAFTGEIGRLAGMVLVLCLALYLTYNIRSARANPRVAEDVICSEEALSSGLSLGQASMLTAAGLVGLVLGADFLVSGSVDIARTIGVSEAIIGLTLVAIGTSLPELVTSLAAAYRSQCDVAVGNVVGSNIFNLLCIMGITALVGTVPVPMSFLQVDLWVMLGSSALLLLVKASGGTIGRSMGVIFLLLYGSYITWLVYSGSSMAHMSDMPGP